MSGPETADRLTANGVSILRRARPLLATYVQQRYLGLWTDRQDMIERLHGFQMERARRLGQDHVVQNSRRLSSKPKESLNKSRIGAFVNRSSPNSK